MNDASARQYIEDALVYASGTHTADDVLEAVAQGKMQLWRGPNSVIVTEIAEYPRCRVINFFLAGGERSSMAEMEQMEPLIIEWAKQQGCTKATFLGRPGWMRTFVARAGWREAKTVVLEKSLGG